MGKELIVEITVTEYNKEGVGRRKFDPFATGRTEEEASKIAIQRLGKESMENYKYRFDIRAVESDLLGLAEDVIKDLEEVGSVV